MRLHEDVKPELRILLFEITEKCNAACEQCGSRCDASKEEKLKKDEILSVLRDVKEHFGTGVMLNVTGGEPLLRKDLFEIMTEAHRMGFDWGMVTNGSLIDDRVIDEMKRSGMKTVTVSIDGMKETHESLRHLPGSFDRIINGLRKL
ncbi:MAG: radical SAM protein, partial [Lachnospiraceae bacterium]|nr:radical SAM protein [Lachnospiraceae bacterium]